MKKFTQVFLAMVLITGFVFAETPAPLEIGADLPQTKQAFKDVSGAQLTLNEVADKNGLLVVFTCNSCPYVLAWQDRYPEIAKYCKSNNIGLLMVNPNEARRTSSDSYEAMVQHAKENNYDFHYALDANHELADAMGATKTPDVFLFNNDLKLVYKGAIDDNYKDAAAVKEPYLNMALANLVSKKAIDPTETKAIGCSIKRVQ